LKVAKFDTLTQQGGTNINTYRAPYHTPTPNGAKPKNFHTRNFYICQL